MGRLGKIICENSNFKACVVKNITWLKNTIKCYCCSERNPQSGLLDSVAMDAGNSIKVAANKLPNRNFDACSL